MSLKMNQIKIFSIVIFACFFVATKLNGQRRLTEGTITYDVYINTGSNNTKSADLLDGATNIIYIKGNFSRSEMTSSLGTESTIFDAKTNTATILKEYGDQRYIISLNAKEWKEHNSKYENITYTLENEYKTIANHNCQKATGKLSDGTLVTAYFTKDILPISNNAQYFNKNLPGLMLLFEVQLGKAKVTYTANSINLAPVPLSKFDLPKAGYRILNYKELSSNK